jgi:PhnB protein
MFMSNAAPIPHLVVNDGEAAIAFYERAFGATLEGKRPAEDGKRLMHAHLKTRGRRNLFA